MVRKVSTIPSFVAVAAAGFSLLSAAPVVHAQPTQGVSKDEIVIGTIQDLSGPVSPFGKAARNGRQVRQGELIGYVGSTGASTGPHLHYEYRVNGVHKNPATILLPNTEVPATYVAEFRRDAQQALAQLRATSGAGTQQLADNR